MSIRRSHRWRTRPNKLIWMTIGKSPWYGGSLDFSYRRYENGRKSFMLFMQKWVYFKPRMSPLGEITVTAKYYRYFYRNGEVKKTTKITCTKLTNTSHPVFLIVHSDPKKLIKRSRADHSIISTVEQRQYDIFISY